MLIRRHHRDVAFARRSWLSLASLAIGLSASISAMPASTAEAAPKASRRTLDAPPLVLERTIAIPGIPVGPYSDDVEFDLEGNRVFATPQAGQAVAVLDLRSGQMIKLIKGAGNPHGLFYEPSHKRLFVVDGSAGEVKVYDGNNYSLIRSIPLTKGADGLIYDPGSKFLYISNGGDAAGMPHALLSIIDPERMEKVGEIEISTTSLEGGDVDPDRHLIYINLEKDDNAVAVIDLRTRRQVAVWKLPPGHHRGKGIALDRPHNRLYVASRDTEMHGSIFVLDATTGRYIKSLPIAGWVDGISIDDKRQRIYTSSGLGYIETYAIGRNDTFRREEPVESALLAKTGTYSSELDRFVVDVPHLGDFGSAQVMVFRPRP